METLFRFHRGGLAESLETTVFVTGLPAIRKYINDTDGIRDELSRKAPEFLKDFDKDLAAIHRDYVGDSISV